MTVLMRVLKRALQMEAGSSKGNFSQEKKGIFKLWSFYDVDLESKHPYRQSSVRGILIFWFQICRQ